jgi:hypothetical protein
VKEEVKEVNEEEDGVMEEKNHRKVRGTLPMQSWCSTVNE